MAGFIDREDEDHAELWWLSRDARPLEDAPVRLSPVELGMSMRSYCGRLLRCKPATGPRQSQLKTITVPENGLD